LFQFPPHHLPGLSPILFPITSYHEPSCPFPSNCKPSSTSSVAACSFSFMSFLLYSNTSILPMRCRIFLAQILFSPVSGLDNFVLSVVFDFFPYDTALPSSPPRFTSGGNPRFVVSPPYLLFCFEVLVGLFSQSCRLFFPFSSAIKATQNSRSSFSAIHPPPRCFSLLKDPFERQTETLLPTPQKSPICAFVRLN